VSAFAGTAGTSIGVAGDGYNLAAAIAEMPFAIDLPAEPTITSETVCTTNSEVTASLAVNGRRTIIAPGSYSFGQLIVGGSDKEIVLQPGANLNFSAALDFSAATRVRWDGGGATVNTDYEGFTVVINAGSTDIQLLRTHFLNADTTWSGGLALAEYSSTPISRILVLGCGFESERSTGYIGGNNAGNNVTHLAIANSSFRCRTLGVNGWAMRFTTNASYIAFIDSYWRALANTTIRYEPPNSSHFYMRRNQVENGNFRGLRNTGVTASNHLWFYDNKFYNIAGSGYAGNGLVSLEAHPTTQNLTADGNEGYAEDSIGWEWWRGDGNWTIGTNPHYVTPGSWPTPPTWVMQ